MCIYIWAFPLFCNALRLVKATLNGCINSLSEYVSYPYSVRTIKKAQLPDCSKSFKQNSRNILFFKYKSKEKDEFWSEDKLLLHESTRFFIRQKN